MRLIGAWFGSVVFFRKWLPTNCYFEAMMWIVNCYSADSVSVPLLVLVSTNLVLIWRRRFRKTLKQVKCIRYKFRPWMCMLDLMRSATFLRQDLVVFSEQIFCGKQWFPILLSKAIVGPWARQKKNCLSVVEYVNWWLRISFDDCSSWK